MSQGELAHKTAYHRTSIAHFEAGRRFPERAFWEKADDILGASGALLAQYEKIRHQEMEAKKAEFVHAQAERQERLNQLTRNIRDHAKEAEPSSLAVVELLEESSPIDSCYVTHIRNEIKSFVRMDQQYGGAAASPTILQAYRQIRRRVRSGEMPRGLRRDVYSVLSELAEVAGWSLYDSGDDMLTERVNNESLSLARMAGDRSMELFVLQNMAMHAETIGRPREAINISHLVLETSRLPPRIEALFRLRLARSYGRLQDEFESKTQLERARALFQDGVRDSDPHWCWWVNEAQLGWFEGSIRVDLGKYAEAVDHLERSASAVPEPRMNFIYRAWALYAYCLNSSWVNVERLLRNLIGDVGVFRSGRASAQLSKSLGVIDNGNPPSTVRDLSSALRTALANAA